jgi:glycosyltransferase involved in cell wall biosynthesis
MKISIITPSYNQGLFIERTIKSVLGQNGNFELEYIIVDGGSTDNSLEIIKQYAALDKRLKYISEPDEGQTDAINNGLKIATGEIVAYLNSDDLYVEGSLTKVADFFRNNPEEKILTGYCKIIDENDKEIRKLITWYKNIKLRNLTFHGLLIENCISQPATFWRRSLHETLGYLNKKLNYVMDYEFWCSIGAKYKINVLHCYLAAFRLYATSKSGYSFKNMFNEQNTVVEKYLKDHGFIGFLREVKLFIILSIYSILQKLNRH